MVSIDYLVIGFYLVLLVWIGYKSSKKISNANDMFSASNSVPWWYAGLSSYMTMFSAGTFVVWGGITYKLGLVGIVICETYGISGFIIAYTIAKRWHNGGYSSVAEFISIRYGKKTLQIYTWLNLIVKIITCAIAIYAIAVLVSAIMPVAKTNPLSDSTGHVAVAWLVTLFSLVIIVYTVIGGLWAVILTDMIQFIVLTASVLLMIPFAIIHGGGIHNIIHHLPHSFLSPTAGQFTWLFLIGWTIVNALSIGGNWEFVQRTLTVKTSKDAVKLHILFGAIYLISPVFWMLPPLILKTYMPNVNPSQAYILVAQDILPTGLIGLIVVSMFSATASMASGIINVLAGAVTRNLYLVVRPGASDKEEVRIGKLITLIMGAVVLVVCLLIPYMGGVEKVVLSYTSLLLGPLLLPTIWGLFSKYLKAKHIWITMIISALFSLTMKYGFYHHTILTKEFPFLGHLAQANTRVSDLFGGLVIPFVVLSICEYVASRSKQVVEGYINDQKTIQLAKAKLREEEKAKVHLSNQTKEETSLIAQFIFVLGILLAFISIFSEQKALLIGYGGMLIILGSILWYQARKNLKK